tara:strand:- start:1180 stop:1542 length:363 start_codon:yes stop_codon:yes gene_type:complete
MHVWKDVNCDDTVIIGDKAEWQSHGETRSRLVAWCAIHPDGLHDLFGGDVKDAVERLKHQPPGTTVEVQLAVLRVGGEDVSGCETAKHQLEQAANAIGPSCDGIRHDLVEANKWMEDLGI